MWVEFKLSEGKNREIRNIVEFFGMKVERLKRVSYGDFRLGNLKEGETKEVDEKHFPSVVFA